MDPTYANRSDDAAAPTDLTIGQLAALTGVTAEAIRYYEREGVVPPAARRGTGQYRHYGPADAVRLRFVRRARALGFSLEDVRELLALAAEDANRPCADVNRIARNHLAHVDVKLTQLAALRAELQRLVEACEDDVVLATCSLLSALSHDG
ncbi:MAG: MerR family DNA-binding protein [Gemmatimonadaceae bacterium]|jgi:DNA-binding transcriptional MerR regulator|nr:MerR family DNA-binding protein [Gemmatimonadaceae bacterium]